MPSSQGLTMRLVVLRSQVQIFDVTGSEAGRLQSEFMTAIPTRMCIHPTASVIAASTSSGRMHIYRMP